MDQQFAEAPEPAGPPQANLVEAVYPFTGSERGDLTFAAGDLLSVLEQRPDGWLFGEVHSSSDVSMIGMQGVFPESYTVAHMLDEGDERQAAQMIQKLHRGKKARKVVEKKKKQSVGIEDGEAVTADAELVVAMYDFYGQEEGDLSFSKGEQIWVIERRGGRLDVRPGTQP